MAECLREFLRYIGEPVPPATRLDKVDGHADGWQRSIALGRLRQWAAHRRNLRNGKMNHMPLVLRGRPTEGNRRNAADAALVQVLDFERVLNALPEQQRMLLVLHFRDGQPMREVAIAIGVCERTAHSIKAAALDALSERLDRADLL